MIKQRDRPPHPSWSSGMEANRHGQSGNSAMFVIELVYKADLHAIDAHMGSHVRFL
jgi:hypothetical protein